MGPALSCVHDGCHKAVVMPSRQQGAKPMPGIAGHTCRLPGPEPGTRWFLSQSGMLSPEFRPDNSFNLPVLRCRLNVGN
jgi:hypothetical protein